MSDLVVSLIALGMFLLGGACALIGMWINMWQLSRLDPHGGNRQAVDPHGRRDA